MQLEHPYTQETALALFAVLVEKDKGFDEAIEAAQKGMESKNNDVQKPALALWTALVEQLKKSVAGGKNIDQAIAAVKIGMKSTEDVVLKAARDLFKALVEKLKESVAENKNIDQSIAAVKIAM